MKTRHLFVGVPVLLVAVAAGADVVIESQDPRCVAVPTPFPPGFELVDGIPGLAAMALLDAVQPFDIEVEPPQSAAPGPFPSLSISIAEDACDGERPLAVDGVHIEDSGLALMTGSTCESVAFIDPTTGDLRSLDVGMPAELPEGAYPYAPPPGTSGPRVAVSTWACVAPPAPALDSFGEPIPDLCTAGSPSYRTSFTSGAAVAAGRMFVSTSNLGAGRGTLDTQFLPGTVLVYTFDQSVDPPVVAPDAMTPVIFTSGFNPTHVTRYTTPGGRELLLVNVSGATGLVPDDPNTAERESGGIARTEAAIDVIDPVQMRLVASIPLGLAALAFDRPAIDPSGRVAMVGSSIDRHVYAVDLAPVDALSPAADYVRLDGIAGPDAVIFDADSPFVLPALPAGPSPATCPGFVVGMAFRDDGRAVYATDFCDGTLTEIRVDLAGDPPAPVPGDGTRFAVDRTLELVAPLVPESLGLPRAPGTVRVRPGQPGLDFDGPEVLFSVGLPEGLLCAIRVPEPGAGTAGAVAVSCLGLLARRRRRAAIESKTVPGGESDEWKEQS